MTPAQLFGVAVRTIGLLMTIGSALLFFLAALILGSGGPENPLGIVILAMPIFLIGLWLLRGPRSVTAFAYPEERLGSRAGQVVADTTAARPAANWKSIGMGAGVLITAIAIAVAARVYNTRSHLSEPIMLQQLSQDHFSHQR